MIRKIFNQNQIIQAIDRYRKDEESARIILDSIKDLNTEKYPLEAIFPLQWILESLLKKILEKHNMRASNMISKNLKIYFKKYPNIILDREQIEYVREIRNYFNHSGVIRDKIRMPIMINSYILAIEFIAMEADIDLNSFIPPSSTEQIKRFAKENEKEIEEQEKQEQEREERKKRQRLYWMMSIPFLLIIASFFLYQHYYKITILTGFKDGTYYKMATELRDNYEDNIDVIESEGSEYNLKQLGEKKVTGFAFVQEDVLNRFEKEAREGKESYQKMLKNIYLLRPIVKGEIHILVREDSSMEHFMDLEDKEIAIGAEHSGNAITSQAIYEQLFPNKKMNKHYSSSFQKSLDALKQDNHIIDAIVVLGGEPLTKLKRLKGVKLLSYERDKELSGYKIGKIEQNSYNSWLKSDKRTLTVTSFLVTNIVDENDIVLLSILNRLKKSIKKHKSSDIHKKWREFPQLNCLPKTISNRIIYHSTTRMSNYCREE